MFCLLTYARSCVHGYVYLNAIGSNLRMFAVEFFVYKRPCCILVKFMIACTLTMQPRYYDMRKSYKVIAWWELLSPSYRCVASIMISHKDRLAYCLVSMIGSGDFYTKVAILEILDQKSCTRAYKAMSFTPLCHVQSFWDCTRKHMPSTCHSWNTLYAVEQVRILYI